MTKPDTEDLILFGSVALAALGVALIAFSLTSQPALAVGLAFIVFGIPSALIILMAAGDNS